MEKNLKKKTKHLDIEEIIENLSQVELKLIPFLKYDIEKIKEISGLDEVTIIRALKFLENKGILAIKTLTKNIIDLGTNGIYYKKNHLPERKLLAVIETNNHILLEEAKKLSKLSENEFRVSLGILKDKAFISLSNGKISIIASKMQISKKLLE